MNRIENVRFGLPKIELVEGQLSASSGHGNGANGCLFRSNVRH